MESNIHPHSGLGRDRNPTEKINALKIGLEAMVITDHIAGLKNGDIEGVEAVVVIVKCKGQQYDTAKKEYPRTVYWSSDCNLPEAMSLTALAYRSQRGTEDRRA